jgi:predicted transcriptional regulator
MWMKRTHKEVREAILEVLSDNKEHAYGDLERKANTNWQTIRDHCQDLELFGAVTINKENKVKITKQGLELLKKIKH